MSADTLAPPMPSSSASATRPGMRYAAAAKSLSERRAREDEIQRQLGALPHLAALREAESQCAPLEGLPAPPEGWRDEVAALAGRGDQARGAEGDRGARDPNARGPAGAHEV